MRIVLPLWINSYPQDLFNFEIGVRFTSIRTDCSSHSWTDKAVSGEISEGKKDLEEMLQKLTNEESSAKDSLELKADVIILKREFMSKVKHLFGL